MRRKNTIKVYTRKLNSIERKISEALINDKISHEDFMTIINQKKNTEN